MKKVICLMLALLMCMSLVLPAMAEESTFIPSNGPEVKSAVLEGEDVADKLIVTSVTEAKEAATEVSQEARDLLVTVYDALSDGSMKLPLQGEYVIRELVDISWKQEACVDAEHPHQQELNKDGVTVTLELEMGITEKNELLVFAYHNGQWDPVKEVKINGDGTVTCVFEHFCPVAFAFRQEAGGSQTGDAAREDLMGYVMLMTLSAAAILLLVLRRRKHTR